MKITTCLVLEEQDFTRDSNLKKEAFAAFAAAELVIHEGRVIKTGASLLPQGPQEPVKRIRRRTTPQIPPNAPQRPTEPFAPNPGIPRVTCDTPHPAPDFNSTDQPPSFDDISSES